MVIHIFDDNIGVWFLVLRTKLSFSESKICSICLNSREQFKTAGADVEFTCQHGPNECYGNKVHACAIQHIQVSVQFAAIWFDSISMVRDDEMFILRFVAGEFISKYKNPRISYLGLCGLFDAYGKPIQGSSISRRKMRKRSSITQLACDWRMCQHNRRQQIVAGLRRTHLPIETIANRSANHHIQSCKFIKWLETAKTAAVHKFCGF